ncbi:MerR family transcriptional regulator [Nocardia blacklockiae]|uniref:MerR family transcriptional regulator n=1 Tax=Nocardia blacklockiae TaxID=480036 RepID=UPI0018945406|nr:MerR family transcriptional regulator [Nocardia blacklockiae]MBF6171018.1 MerR family transcriptional regulator [Nocardia blacklockiae]
MATEDLMARILDEIGDFAGIDATIPVETIHRLVDTGDDPAPMSIAEVADMLDLSAHSIRYYERAGLISVTRDARGHRVYDAEAQRRLVFITRMRLSGMPMRDLQHYIHLVEAGDDSIPERLDMLIEHRDTIRRRIRELNLSLAATEYKIATYQHHGDVLGGTIR